MGKFSRYIGGKAQVETTSAPQQVEQSNTQELSFQDILNAIAGLRQEIPGIVDERINARGVGVADSVQVNAPVPPATPSRSDDGEWVYVGDIEGTLTQAENSVIRSAASWAQFHGGGYPNFVQDGWLHVGKIERLRAQAASTAKPPVSNRAPAKSQSTSKGARSNGKGKSKGKPARPSPALNTPLATLAKQRQYSVLEVFLPDSKNHAHANWDIVLSDGSVLPLRDFPYTKESAVTSGGFIKKTFRKALTAYFGDIIANMPDANVTGGVRDQFSMAIAEALGGRSSNTDFNHALSGHRNSDDWLLTANKALRSA